MKLGLMGLILVLAGCLPSLQTVDPERIPSAENWGPKPSPLEWWYVSGYLPEEGLAFHWATFKAYMPQSLSPWGIQVARLFPGPFHASHIVVTDLRSNQKVLKEKSDFALDRTKGDAIIQFPPLYIQQDDWRFIQVGKEYHLEAGPLQLRLTPLKPAVVHPQAYSGTVETGRMYYLSFTRMRLEGSINGRAVRGEAWMDHQWGDQIGFQENELTALGALWDWFGLHLSSGEDVMLYRVKNRAGKVVQLAGTLVDLEGKAYPLSGLQMTPLQTWNSPSGRSYPLSWRVEADGLNLRLDPLRNDQELLTASTRVAYWEGAVSGTGSWRGQTVLVHGMGEFVAGSYAPPASSLVPQPLNR